MACMTCKNNTPQQRLSIGGVQYAGLANSAPRSNVEGTPLPEQKKSSLAGVISNIAQNVIKR